MPRHFLSVSSLGPSTLNYLAERALEIARNGCEESLTGKTVGLYFRKSSTRTRTAFSVGAMKLGATIIAYGPADLQIFTGESVQDTAKVLSGFLDGLVVRTNDAITEMENMAMQNRMAIINAMADAEHPTQAIADLTTIREAFGRLFDLHILYLGEGNNTTAALALAVAQVAGLRLTIVSPEGYGLGPAALERIASLARRYGGIVEQHHDIGHLSERVDVVYTTRWETMGVPKQDANWKRKFDPYRVTRELLAKVSKPGTIFLHDLPAMRGVEVDDDVLDGEQSLAFRQARHKMTSAMAILEWCLPGD
jgi:ornithine carbamoyltransferase